MLAAAILFHQFAGAGRCRREIGMAVSLILINSSPSVAWLADGNLSDTNRTLGSGGRSIRCTHKNIKLTARSPLRYRIDDENTDFTDPLFTWVKVVASEIDQVAPDE